ncbi:MAG TPA: ABC transporter ATP-binding protein [Nitrososphaerales archaeon]|nr:ABC transporter ATP-binding protein [Nitrososphaerales archaeon]
MSSVAIKVEGLVKTYGAIQAVNNISFEINEGEIFALLGPNGAGKTTTLEILQSLRKATKGSVCVLGYDVSNNKNVRKLKKEFGVLPQDFNAIDKLTVKENLSVIAKMYDKHVNLDKLILTLDLEDKANSKFEDLSGGLKQRLGIAGALVNDPKMVFLDEPTTGLDPRARRDVWRVIEELKKEGKTIFLTTHYMDEAEILADRVAIIHKGKIVAIGETKTLLEKNGGGRTVILEDVPESIAKEIKNRFPKATIVGTDVRIQILKLKEVNEVISYLTKKGLEQSLQITRPSLENVFLELTGVHLTEEGELA